MKRQLLFLTGLFLAGCAREPLLPGIPRSERMPPTSVRPPEADTTRHEPGRTGVYLTAVRFADGYDWERDTCRTERMAFIDIYRDGMRIRSFPAGESIEPDMHRMVGGHLYQDWSTDRETVVSRDGEELFRYPGREALRGFLVVDGQVHTLGQDRDGAGLCYRIDGQEIFRDAAGTVLGDPDAEGWPGGALTLDGGEVCYSYSVPVNTGGTSRREYRIMQGATRIATVQAGTFYELFDIRVLQGTLWRVEMRTSAGNTLSLVKGKDIYSLPLGAQEHPHLCRLMPWSDGMLVKGYTSGPSWAYRYFVLDEKGTSLKTSAPGVSVVSLLSADGHLAWLTGTGQGRVTALRKDAPPQPGELPDGDYTLLSGRCALLHEGVLYAALTGCGGTVNRLIIDATATDFPFNGYFTSVSVQ
ncbi:MAG: hypothetical protein IJ721_03460 [Bacteroidales bacterium]|nr:hypothetical protein [Bacteroidales bacterium]